MSSDSTETKLNHRNSVKSDGWKSFLVPLVNATLVLAILLAVSGTVLVYKVHSFATDVISDVKVGLLRDMDNDIRLIKRSFQDGERDLRRIAARLDAITKNPEITLSPEIQQDIRSLRTEVDVLNQRLGELASNREALTDHAIHTLASSFAQAYIDMRRCHVEATAPARK